MLLVQIEAKRVLLARDDLSDGVPDHSAPFGTIRDTASCVRPTRSRTAALPGAKPARHGQHRQTPRIRRGVHMLRRSMIAVHSQSLRLGRNRDHARRPGTALQAAFLVTLLVQV